MASVEGAALTLTASGLASFFQGRSNDFETSDMQAMAHRSVSARTKSGPIHKRS